MRVDPFETEKWEETKNKTRDLFCHGWPLVGNEGINLYIGILGIHSLIPY